MRGQGWGQGGMCGLKESHCGGWEVGVNGLSTQSRGCLVRTIEFSQLLSAFSPLSTILGRWRGVTLFLLLVPIVCIASPLQSSEPGAAQGLLQHVILSSEEVEENPRCITAEVEQDTELSLRMEVCQWLSKISLLHAMTFLPPAPISSTSSIVLSPGLVLFFKPPGSQMPSYSQVLETF